MATEKRKPTSALRIEKPVSLVLQVEQALRRAISDGKFPGGRLPTENELAETFGVSRETVRRAADVLQGEGILQKFRRRGTEIVRGPRAMDVGRASTRTLLGYVAVNYASSASEPNHLTLGSSSLLLQGAIDAAGFANCELIVRSVRPGEVRAAVSQLAEERGIEGAILASVTEEKSLRRLGGRPLPLVLLDHDLHVPRTCSVRDDSAYGSRLAVQHLAELGHREIAYVHLEPADLNPWRPRGYREGLRSAGLRRRQQLELFAEISPAGADAAAKKLLQLSPRPTAVVCFSNTLARWLTVALRRLGERVPETFSVVGCGGEEITDLTMCQTDWYDMGRQTLQLLLQRVKNPALAVEHRQIVPYLKTGMTSGPPPRAVAST